MAVTTRFEESAQKVKEETGGRDGVAEEKIHGRDAQEGVRAPQPFGSSSQGLFLFISWLLSLCRFPMVRLL